MRSLLAAAAVIVAITPGPARADDTDTHASLQGVGVADQGLDLTSGGHGPHIVGGDGHVYVVTDSCGLGGESICQEAATGCFNGDAPGRLVDVYRDGDFIGQQCLTPAEAEQQPVLTPGIVTAAFRRLHWPSSELLIEPPGGRTLVNFATNFHTDNADPSRQTVTLLGQRVTIEATPATYSWHFGDGDSVDTDRPGSAYPTLDITHDYGSKGAMTPSVDTTYAGRYRVGNGPWLTIPATLTVDGAGVALTVTTARPTLVQP